MSGFQFKKKMLILFCAALVFTVGRCTDDQYFATKTVAAGEDVTLTCSRSKTGGLLFWKRVVAGKLPEVLGATYTFDHPAINQTPHFTAKQGNGTYVLHIKQTKLSDTAFYYCEQILELQITFLNVTLLIVKGPELDITAVIQDFPPDPVHPGDSVSLQCSVLSASENQTCSEGHSVFWFRAGSDESHLSLIRVHRNRGDECESPEDRAPQKCVYNFNSFSDVGKYHCAVATCGQIIFGEETKQEIND
ncbi:uncharacterized protein LOC125008527 [Mugil cephalus]|uniref:uncharacterized protein LOC125008527 n=1 Tax=Mugil cephalus TaxID=48193 RepID=UPI001FB702A1|nr:uncharacterized protein LOC125008527 [Mugil cephalus]